jgi:thiamine biosynthesis lipoprotein
MRIFREIEVWGTVLVVDVASTTLTEEELESAIEEVTQCVHRVDQLFSTYKERSQVSKIRRNELSIDEADPYVIEVWKLCEQVKELTFGAFDPWSVSGGFDPSGLVKGWAADKCADLLISRGATHVLINAAGDLTLRGGELKDGEVTPWMIGISDPENPDNIVKTYEITNGAIATSGDYEKGAHIHDPFTGLIAIGAKSVSVLGPNGAIADALATAIMVSGIDGAPWFDQPELHEYEVFAINRHHRTSWSYSHA